MKPEHTKNIKKFIKKYKSVLKLPFMSKFFSEPSVEATGKPIVQILPSLDQAPEEDTTGISKLAAKYDPNAKVSGGFGKSPVVTILNSGNKKEAALTGEVKGDGPETIVRSLSGQSDSVIPHSYLRSTTSSIGKSPVVTILNSSNNKETALLGNVKGDSPKTNVRTLSGQSDSVIPHSYLKPTDTPRVMSAGNKLISLPKTDAKKLVDLSLTKQITNKITKTKNNEYTLNIPEYGIGKNILAGLMKVAAQAKPAISKAATKVGSALTEKLSPLTDALKSAKNMGMSLIAAEKRNEPSSAPRAAAEPQSTPALPPNPPIPHVASKEFPAQAIDGTPVSEKQYNAVVANSVQKASGGTAGELKREQIRATDNILNAAKEKPLIPSNTRITPEQVSQNNQTINTIPGMAAPAPTAAPAAAPAAPVASVAAAPAPAAAPAAPVASVAAAPAPAAAPTATPVAASGSISAVAETPKNAPTKIEGEYDSGVGPGTTAEELKAQAESAQKALPEPEARGAGAGRGIEGIVDAVTTVAQVALTVGTGGVGGAAMGALKGVGAMAGGASKVAGGLGKVSKLAGAMPGGGEGGGGGGGGGMGVPGGGMGSMLGGGGGVALAGGALAAVGGIAAGVGGVAAGIGSAVGGLAGAYATVGGKLIDAVFGGNDKKESPVSVSTDSRSNSTVVNSISNQYDIYRKTADDSFMLPNYRREYG